MYIKISKSKSHEIYSKKILPKKRGDYIYFIRIGEESERLFKIGTTNRPYERMREHAKYYNRPIYILWFSPTYSKYTTLRVEDKAKDEWKQKKEYQYIKNDRFIINEKIQEVKIKVRKTYTISLN